MKYSRRIWKFRVLGRRWQVFRQRNGWLWGSEAGTWWLGPVFVRVD